MSPLERETWEQDEKKIFSLLIHCFDIILSQKQPNTSFIINFAVKFLGSNENHIYETWIVDFLNVATSLFLIISNILQDAAMHHL